MNKIIEFPKKKITKIDRLVEKWIEFRNEFIDALEGETARELDRKLGIDWNEIDKEKYHRRKMNE